MRESIHTCATVHMGGTYGGSLNGVVMSSSSSSNQAAGPNGRTIQSLTYAVIRKCLKKGWIPDLIDEKKLKISDVEIIFKKVCGKQPQVSAIGPKDVFVIWIIILFCTCLACRRPSMN